MTILTYNIKKKVRQSGSIRLANLNDFLVEKEGASDERELLNNKSLSIYCIDHKNRLVVFVQTKEPFSLQSSTFLWESQYTFAEKVFTVSYEEFFHIANEIECSMENICMLFSVGRCGSTLLHKMFGKISSIISLSEADVYSQVQSYRENGKMEAKEACDLLECATKFIWNSVEATSDKILLLKFRSEVIRSWYDFTQAIPTKKLIFMYRNAEDVVQSFNRMLGRWHGKKKFFLRLPLLSSLHKLRRRYLLSRRVSNFDSYSSLIEGITPIEFLVELGSLGETLFWWLSKVSAYMEMRGNDLPIIAIRYEDITSRPFEVFQLLLEHLGFPTDEIDNACDQIKSDSQRGTRLANNLQHHFGLDSTDREAIQSAIELYTEYSGSSHILPGTLGHLNNF